MVERMPFARKSLCWERFKDMEKLDVFHCIRRFGRACFSDDHAAYPRFMTLLLSVLFVVHARDLEALNSARHHLKLSGDPNKMTIRRYCRNSIPPPTELEKRVQSVLRTLLNTRDSQGISLFSTRVGHPKDAHQAWLFILP